MPTITDRIRLADDRLTEIESDLAKIAGRSDELRAQLEALSRGGGGIFGGAGKLRERQRIQSRLLALAARREGLLREQSSVIVRRDTLKTDLEHQARLGEWPGGDTPIVLLPVRLETRFESKGKAGAELWLRIFPDDIHIDAHEATLSVDEQSAGQSFWRSWLTNDERSNARRRLVESFGRPRSECITAATRPANLEDVDRPDELAFPSLETSDDWFQTPIAAALPDQWVAVATRGDDRRVVAHGAPIISPLAVGFDPTNTAESDGPLAEVAPRWIVEFDEAERVGMAMRIPIMDQDLRFGFDSVMVWGVSQAGADAGALRLTTLFDQHRGSAGVSLLAPGTPTNNTADAPAQIESATEPFVSEPGLVAPPDSDGALLGRAFGVPATSFGVAGTQTAADQKHQRAMNALVWPATGEYFFEQFVTDPETTEELGKHFVSHVRASGSLPAVVVGNQPYGVLAVGSLNDEPDASGPQLLQKLRRRWQEVVDDVPRAGMTEGALADAESTLLDVLGSSATTRSYEARPVLDTSVFNADPILSEDDDAVVVRRRQLLAPLATDLGIPPDARIIDTVLAANTFDITKNEVLAPELLDWLAEASPADLRNERLPDNAEPPASLLYMVLRHSMLLSLSRAALDIRIEAGLAAEGDRIDPSWVDVLEPGTATAGRQIAAELPAGMADLASLTEADHPALAQVDVLRANLRLMKSVEADRLDTLFRASLDCFGHRLDPWISSLATRRLDRIRSHSAATVIGGFGWVENVRRSGLLRPVDELPPSEEGPLLRDPSSGGHVRASSLQHATTAAVLRSGFLNNSPEDNTENPLAINLGSTRVRAALQVLDGVRQGHDLRVLLGQRFERMLHDRELDRFIDDVRRATPLALPAAIQRRIDILERGIVPPDPDEIKALKAERQAAIRDIRAEFGLAPTSGLESIADHLATRIVDGQALVEMWRRSGSFDFWGPALPARGTAAHDALGGALVELDDLLDSVADLLTAETVHQLVVGAPDRTGETLDAVLRGEAVPPDLEVVQTPRSGSSVTHRVIVPLGSDDAAPGWFRSPADVIARTEPRLDRLFGQLLGDPAQVGATITMRSSDGGSREIAFTLLDLELGAYQTALLAAAGETALAAALQGFLLDRAVGDTPPANGDPEIEFDVRLDHHPTTALSFAEFVGLATAVAEGLLRARPLTQPDLSAAGTEITGWDLDELHTRLQHLRDTVAQLITELDDAIQLGTTEGRRSLLRRTAAAGIREALPPFDGWPARDVEGEVNERLTEARAVLEVRLHRLDQSLSDNADAPAAEHLQQAARHALGQAFLLVPALVEDSVPLSSVFALSEELLAEDPMAGLVWLDQASRVRRPVDDYWRSIEFAEVLAGRDPMPVRVAQHTPGEEILRWVGSTHGPNAVVDGSLSLVAHMVVDLPPDSRVAGVVIDEWDEIFPADHETTGVAFQFDQPGAEAPNAVLVAVAPEGTDRWDFVQLEVILRETYELLQLRAVDPQRLFEATDIDRVLPAIHLAVNSAGDTVSTDLRRLKA